MHLSTVPRVHPSPILLSPTSVAAAPSLPSAPFRVRRDPAVWAEVHRPNVNIVQERRALPTALLACARLAAETERDAPEIELLPTHDRLDGLFDHLPDHPGRAPLEADVCALLARFRALVSFRSVRLKLHAVHHGQCRKFHTDYVPLRLLCTYAGPGTDWVADDGVVRSELGVYDEDIDAANDRIVPDASRVRRAGLGDVLLLRGNAWSAPASGGQGAKRAEGARGAVHRSPPVRSCAEHRLVLVITGLERSRS